MGLRQILEYVTLANQLTFLRLVAIPFFILAVLEGSFGLALGLFIGAALTDLLDGLTARMFEQRTTLGAYLDPAADKLLLTAAFVLLTDYPVLFTNVPFTARLPLPLTILAISRDVLIVAIALMLYLAYGATRFRPTIWGKLTTVAELVMVSLFLLFNALGRAHAVLEWAVWITLGLILISGFHYLWQTMRRIQSEEPAGGGDAPP